MCSPPQEMLNVLVMFTKAIAGWWWLTVVNNVQTPNHIFNSICDCLLKPLVGLSHYYYSNMLILSEIVPSVSQNHDLN